MIMGATCIISMALGETEHMLLLHDISGFGCKPESSSSESDKGAHHDPWPSALTGTVCVHIHNWI